MENNRTKILFLYTEVMGYTIAILESLVKNHNADIHIVGWDEGKVSNYEVPVLENISYYKRSEFDIRKLLDLTKKINPSIIYISGWMDKDYLKVAQDCKKNKTPVVCGLDTQWRGILRQYIIAVVGRFFLKRHFDFIWASGIYQYEYARHMGYSKDKILMGVYTADVKKFNLKFNEFNNHKKNNYPHNFLYVGRFTERKGIDTLIEAYHKTLQIKNHDWTLTLIGSGPLKGHLENVKGIIIKDFMQPDKLVNEIKHAGAFCLPSNFEAWGVVIHEFAAAGLPLITSDECGASTEFVKDGYNGYTFKVTDALDLTKKLLKIIDKTNSELNIMGERSNILAQHINPDISAASFMNIISN